MKEAQSCNCNECFADCPPARKERQMPKKTVRPNVAKFLPYWRNYLRVHGAERTRQVLKQGYTTILTRKDRFELLKELELL